VEPLAKRFYHDYSRLRVFKDDLERIVAIVKESGDRLYIEADGFKLSDISYLAKVQESTQSETLERFMVASYVRAEADGTYHPRNILGVALVRGRSAEVSLSDASNTKAFGAAMQIDAVLSARVSTLGLLTSLPAASVYLLLCFVGSTFIMFHREWFGRNQSLGGLLYYLVSFGLLVLGGVLYFIARSMPSRYPIIYLTDSHTHRRLTHDQQARLVNQSVGYALGVLSAVIAGLILWALTR